MKQNRIRNTVSYSIDYRILLKTTFVNDIALQFSFSLAPLPLKVVSSQYPELRGFESELKYIDKAAQFSLENIMTDVQVRGYILTVSLSISSLSSPLSLSHSHSLSLSFSIYQSIYIYQFSLDNIMTETSR